LLYGWLIGLHDVSEISGNRSPVVVGIGARLARIQCTSLSDTRTAGWARNGNGFILHLKIMQLSPKLNLFSFEQVHQSQVMALLYNPALG